MNDEVPPDSDATLDATQDASENQISFNVSIGTDRDKFLRRTCPSCGRDFKTEVDSADLAWALTSQIGRASEELGLPAVSTPEDTKESQLRCPYCHHVAAGSEVHTEETIDYLKRFAYRNYLIPKLNEMFSDLEDSFGRGGGGSGGFISISMSFEHEPIVLPPRPIHGPEPADMTIVEFLCCGRKMKIADRWTAVTECIYCGVEVELR
jgi:hypothetical protein